jgi:branched-chain amino acid transport system substrate-binding protein
MPADQHHPEVSMPHRPALTRRGILKAGAAVLATSIVRPSFAATEPLKIGLIVPLTGPFASTGKQIEAGCRLYMR